MPESTALVEKKRSVPAMQADGAGLMPIVPRNLDEAARYAQGLAKAQMVPDCYREGGKKGAPINVPMVVAAVLKSLEIRMAPQEGIANMYPVNGRLTLWGNGAQSMVQRSGFLEDFVVEKVGQEPDIATPRDKWAGSYGYKVKAKRIGVTSYFEATFTVNDARVAGLWSKPGPWATYPDRMLFNRARAYVFRDGFADALSGMGIYEELIGVVPESNRQALLSSALDDDVTDAEMRSTSPENLPQMVEEYLNGLQTQTTLAELMDYQSDARNGRILSALRDSNPDEYDKLIAAGAKRYQEIEKAEADARDTEEAETEEIEPDPA